MENITRKESGAISRSIKIEITSEGVDIARAVSYAFEIAAEIGFDKNTRFMIATAASELARNILFHATAGLIEIREIVKDSQKGVEIIAGDRGPGIADIAQAMQDHFSSNGGLGLGLPGVKRLMDDFEIESTPGAGTCVAARKWLKSVS